MMALSGRESIIRDKECGEYEGMSLAVERLIRGCVVESREKTLVARP